MGQVCSGGASVSKQVETTADPEDQDLERLEMQATKIAEFDTTFDSAAGPLNELVDIHNGISASGENLHQAAAALQGATQVRLTLDAQQRVALTLWHYDDDGNEVVEPRDDVHARVATNAHLDAAYTRVVSALTDWNAWVAQTQTPSQRPPIQVHHGRLVVPRRTKGRRDRHVVQLNRTLFTFRKHLATHTHGTSLKDAMQCLQEQVATVSENRSLRVKKSEQGSFQVYAGETPLSCEKIQQLPKPAQALYQALTELQDNVQEAVTSVPALADQLQQCLTQAQAFPSMVPNAAMQNHLSVLEIPKAAKATASNVKALSAGPRIAKATLAMIQTMTRELTEAMTKPMGA